MNFFNSSKRPLTSPLVLENHITDLYGTPGAPKTLWPCIGPLLGHQGPQKGIFGLYKAPKWCFWTISPTGWFKMSCNCLKSSENSVATIWTPHMPIFRSKQLPTKNGPLWKGLGPKKRLLGPGGWKRDPICAIKHIYLTNQHNSSGLGLFGLMGPLKPFMGPQKGSVLAQRAPFWPYKRP